MLGPLTSRLGVAAGALGALGAGTLGYFLRRPLPRWEGELRLRGLNGPVDVTRDRWGIPHISALDLHDAFFAQGYCHAQDRLWQMELNRRIARGQLSEIFGAEGLDIDRFMRRLGLHRAAQRELDALTGDTRVMLHAYADGVNASIDSQIASRRLPLELALAGFEPRRWEPLDSLSFARYFAFTQSPNWESELIRSRLIARLGYAAVAELEGHSWDPESEAVPHLSDWGPATAPPPPTPLSVDMGSGPKGSNAWVVSGERSSSGKPLLANDPHLFPRIPSVFYEAHLIGGGDLNVAGATAPGVPGILIGHNRHIAWGFTATMADVQDWYVEQVNPGDPTQTAYNGNWETGTLVRETIKVKGRAQPWVETVLLTARHGPMIGPTPVLADEHRHLALRSSVLEAPTTASALLRLNQAESWDDFRGALSEWGTPSLNAVYADAEGNVGWQMTGEIPIRAKGAGLVPSPGWTGSYEWTGIVPVEEMPFAFNPPDGLWANSNQFPAKGSPHFFGAEFEDPARYHRVREVLEAKPKHSAVDFGALQADERSSSGLEVAALLGEHLQPTSSTQRDALALLREWDGRVTADSPAASIYEAFRVELVRQRFGDQLGDLLPLGFGSGFHPVLAPVWSHYFRLTMGVLGNLRPWAGASPSVTDSVHGAFASAVADLRARLGSDPNSWRWGRLHVLALEHAMSIRKPLGRVFNVGPFAMGGDNETVRKMGSVPGSFEVSGPTAGYRIISDCGDWDATLSCIPGGQSGHRASSHYADQVDDWRRVAYHPLAFSNPAIQRVAKHRLRLRP